MTIAARRYRPRRVADVTTRRSGTPSNDANRGEKKSHVVVVDAAPETLLMLRRRVTPSNDANRGEKSQVDGDCERSSRQPCSTVDAGREALLMLRRNVALRRATMPIAA